MHTLTQAPETCLPAPRGDHELAHLGTMFGPAAVARWLNVSEAVLATMRARGSGPRFVMVGSQVRYPEHELIAWRERAALRAAFNERIAA